MNPISSTAAARFAGPLFDGIAQSAQGFAEVLGVSNNSSSDNPVRPESLESDLVQRFSDFLENLGIDPKQPIQIEVDPSGDLWVVESPGVARGELEARLSSATELKQLFSQWADEHAADGSSQVFHWPRSQ